MSDQNYKKAARIIVKAGRLPFPVNETLIEILKYIIDESDLDIIIAFKLKKSQTMEELKKRSKLSEKEILKKVESLAKKGVIFNQPSSKGVMVYRLLPLMMVGPFEYIFMSKLEHSKENKRLANLFKKLFEETKEIVQEKYETLLPLFHKFPPIDRTIPILENNVAGDKIQISVNEEIEISEETIILTQNVEELINKFDDIAVGHCFCRHHKDLLKNSCKYTDLRENCFTFGKSARYTSEQGFARMVTKDEALRIMRESEEAGLVHKAFHTHEDISKIETSICNCCKDCCATFEMWREGVLPLINYSNFLSFIDKSKCIGCGTCMEKCPVDAIEGDNNNKAERNAEWCIGCGICAHFCPENAISLLKNPRRVFVPPPRLRK
jgi:Pyruvate/2-oxoacid:ferredoxin oxidoreductase delta subunit